MFDKDRTGTIKIDDLFLVALPDDLFSYPKDKINAENVTGDLPDFLRTLKTMTNFENYKSIATTDSSTPAGSTALAAITTSSSKSVRSRSSIISKISKAPFQLLLQQEATS